MKNKSAKTLFLILILSGSIITFLFYAAGSSVKYRQDFVRYTIEESLIAEASLSLNEKYYISGFDSERLWLSKDKHPNRVFETNSKFEIANEIQISIPDSILSKTKNLR